MKALTKSQELLMKTIKMSREKLTKITKISKEHLMEVPMHLRRYKEKKALKARGNVQKYSARRWKC
jgi:hypothetical protein